jgi:hypothetical protein
MASKETEAMCGELNAARDALFRAGYSYYGNKVSVAIGLLRKFDELLDKTEALVKKASPLAKENDQLRALLATSGANCAYCGLPAADMAKCGAGFPGCARMDDAMAVNAPTRQQLIALLGRVVEVLGSEDDPADSLFCTLGRKQVSDLKFEIGWLTGQ